MFLNIFLGAIHYFEEHVILLTVLVRVHKTIQVKKNKVYIEMKSRVRLKAIDFIIIFYYFESVLQKM